jgi:UDPglucose 6-dehydrogenase
LSKIAVIGAGYVGLTTAACFADLGNDVVVVDIDRDKIGQLKQHKVPFYEPGLSELVKRNAASGRLRFTTSYGDAIPGAEYALIAVSTPEGEGGEADLSAVEAAANSIAEAMDGPLVVINKSTVPPLTGDMVSRVMKKRNAQHHAQVVSNPEFLREGSAIQDFMKPDRVVIGGHDREAAENVARLYGALDAPILITDIHTAEMVKYASNAFLAARISFINEIARICERVDADGKTVAEGMGLDRRIGSSYLDVGIGWGGSCFPKDVKALAALAKRFDYHPELLHAVMDINRDQRMLVVDKLKECLDGALDGRTIGLLGLAFKPNTDDLREAPSLDIARVLLAAGAAVRAYDPAAMDSARMRLPEVEYCRDAYDLAAGADAVVIITEWNEFRRLDLPRLKKAMGRPVIIDGRNIYDPEVMRGLGFTYRGIGRE